MEGVVGGDVAGDFGEVVDGVAEVEGDEVGGELGMDRCECAFYCFFCSAQCFYVAEVGDDDVALALG